MPKIKRAFYHASLQDFKRETADSILGKLAKNNHFELTQGQRSAWVTEIEILKECTKKLSGNIFLEFAIPRMGKRADAVLLLGNGVFVLEFKVGSNSFDRDALEQAMDYALDLKNFHEGSKNKTIFPIVIATQAEGKENNFQKNSDLVFMPLCANAKNLENLFCECLSKISADPSWHNDWSASGYNPTPTIIEAAQALYAEHSVSEISRSDSGAINLSITAASITEIISKAKKRSKKFICFITGVPGAGKTLAGLNIANRWQNPDNTQGAVFLSGNGPLVEVLREALSRDEVERQKIRGEKTSKADSNRSVSAFIQNIHHFRDEMLRTKKAPIEKVIIFDEAQRAWDKKQTSSFMQRKRGQDSFAYSEPEFLLSVMDRHKDWAVIVCLIGGGQEINTGEAGIREWYHALANEFTEWEAWVSPNLKDSEYTANGADILLEKIPNKNWVSDLHLATSIRSFRSEKVSSFVKNILDNELEEARKNYAMIQDQYPIALTRSIDTARSWLRRHARGSERYGLMASSGAQRLKAVGIDVKSRLNHINWFLNDKGDVRSSYYLEDAATEFHVQGLELDWGGIIWDADLRYRLTWEYWRFHGTSWQNLRNEDLRRYLKNAYRVLLTRSRQGIIIIVPEGSQDDHTRQAEFYDGTFNFFKDIGIVIE